MIGKTNSKFEWVNVQFFKNNNNSEIRMPYENMQMKIRNKSETQRVLLSKI